MKTRYKILNGLLLLLMVAVVGLALRLSYNSDCGPAPTQFSGADSMQTVLQLCYGPPETLVLSQIEKPSPAANEILIKVHRAAVNPLDWHSMRGSPYFMRLSSGLGAPTDSRFGVDFAGTVESVGADVTQFQPGDAVFGGAGGAFSEYLTMSQDRAVTHKPDNISFDEAAAIPIAALTALQALRDKGQLKAGQKVLINGASGGVGTFAVQIARAMGAEVYGVCSSRNVAMVRALGADHVFDYKKEDYTESGEQFDLVIDMVGNHSPNRNRRVLTPEGRLVIVGGSKGDWLAPILGPLQAVALSPLVSQEMGLILARLDQTDLGTLADMMAAGDLSASIDRHYPLSEIAAALSYSETSRARGKIILDIAD